MRPRALSTEKEIKREVKKIARDRRDRWGIARGALGGEGEEEEEEEEKDEGEPK